MPKNRERWAPYGPPSTALMVIRHYRNRDVPDRLTQTDLVQIGVSEGLLGRVWASLDFLGLIEDDGATTDSFRALRAANDEEYEKVFRGILEAAYSNIFGAIGDPAHASEQQLRNAFHPYSPGAQRSRMITFFLGLCREAGMDLKVPVKQSSVRGDGGRVERPRPKPLTLQSARRAGASAARNSEDAALVAWFDTRPRTDQAWAVIDRDRWLTTLRAIIDGIYRDHPFTLETALATEPEEQPVE